MRRLCVSAGFGRRGPALPPRPARPAAKSGPEHHHAPGRLTRPYHLGGIHTRRSRARYSLVPLLPELVPPEFPPFEPFPFSLPFSFEEPEPLEITRKIVVPSFWLPLGE